MTPEQASVPGPRRSARDDAYDEPYTWGRPVSVYLAPREIARLLILRSKLHDAALPRTPRCSSHEGELAA